MSEMRRRKRKKHYSWPNLPSQLKNSIAREPNHLMQNITSFGSVTKSWRSSSRSCNSSLPKLIEINRKTFSDYMEDARSHIFEIPLYEKCPWPYFMRYKRSYSCPGIYFKGCSYGEVFILANEFSLFYLWDSSSESSCFLPPWDFKIPLKLATSSSKSSDGSNCNLMVLTGLSSPAFAFYRVHEGPYVWITAKSNTKEPYDPGEDMQFCNAIGFKGKFYALSLQGSLVVIEESTDSCFGITGVSRSRAIPSKKSRQYREFLVELNGELLLVFLISRKSIDFVDDIEVFKLDVMKLLLVKVESLGESTLFLEDECCMGVNARKVGYRKNCIYFTHHRIDEWWVFDMETDKMLPFSSQSSKWDEPMELDS